MKYQIYEIISHEVLKTEWLLRDDEKGYYLKKVKIDPNEFSSQADALFWITEHKHNLRGKDITILPIISISYVD